jgi:hypothetical protein
MKRQVTYKQIVSGMTTAGPLAVLLARFILWVNGESAEKDLQQELVRLESALKIVTLEAECYRYDMAERYETPWKVTKDGKRRYRKVATKVLSNKWRTESEPIAPMGLGSVPLKKCRLPIAEIVRDLHHEVMAETVLMDVDWSTLDPVTA